MAETVELHSVVDKPKPVPENVAEIVVLTPEEPSSAPAPAATSERSRPRAAKRIVRIVPEELTDWQARGQQAIHAGSLICFRAPGYTLEPWLRLVEPFPLEECISGRVVDDAERPVAGVAVAGWPEGIELERVVDEGTSAVTG